MDLSTFHVVTIVTHYMQVYLILRAVCHRRCTFLKAQWVGVKPLHPIFCYSLTTGRKEGNVLFIDALNTFYLRLYGVRHMVKDHSDSEKGNPLPPHRLLFPISSKGSFICTIRQTG